MPKKEKRVVKCVAVSFVSPFWKFIQCNPLVGFTDHDHAILVTPCWIVSALHYTQVHNCLRVSAVKTEQVRSIVFYGTYFKQM